ncbi:hypothetical protein HG530_001671 [Fusarium avenaceum]|nr:hypothetical protein HG530_001671 [Fusarium avenaceum]
MRSAKSRVEHAAVSSNHMWPWLNGRKDSPPSIRNARALMLSTDVSSGPSARCHSADTFSVMWRSSCVVTAFFAAPERFCAETPSVQYLVSKKSAFAPKDVANSLPCFSVTLPLSNRPLISVPRSGQSSALGHAEHYLHTNAKLAVGLLLLDLDPAGGEGASVSDVGHAAVQLLVGGCRAVEVAEEGIEGHVLGNGTAGSVSSDSCCASSVGDWLGVAHADGVEAGDIFAFSDLVDCDLISEGWCHFGRQCCCPLDERLHVLVARLAGGGLEAREFSLLASHGLVVDGNTQEGFEEIVEGREPVHPLAPEGGQALGRHDDTAEGYNEEEEDGHEERGEELVGCKGGDGLTEADVVELEEEDEEEGKARWDLDDDGGCCPREPAVDLGVILSPLENLAGFEEYGLELLNQRGTDGEGHEDGEESILVVDGCETDLVKGEAVEETCRDVQHHVAEDVIRRAPVRDEAAADNGPCLCRQRHGVFAIIFETL